MSHFSIRSLMAFVLVSALALAALRNANELWAGMLLLVALGAIGVAVTGAAIMRGRERCWWSGFAFFSGVYLALAIGPWLSDIFQPKLGTTHLLGQLRERIFASTPPALGDAEKRSLLLERQRLEAELAKVKSVVGNSTADPAIRPIIRELGVIRGQLTANKNAGPRTEHFQSVGHSFFALLSGLTGGTIAVWFYSRRERTEATAVVQVP